jgi:toxin HigB-1
MIKGFRNKKTEQFAQGQRVRDFSGFEEQANKRLRILQAATNLNTLSALPSNHLEALQGDRKGQYSIRINAQWRICFIWNIEENNAYDVEIIDYH